MTSFLAREQGGFLASQMSFSFRMCVILITNTKYVSKLLRYLLLVSAMGTPCYETNRGGDQRKLKSENDYSTWDTLASKWYTSQWQTFVNLASKHCVR